MTGFLARVAVLLVAFGLSAPAAQAAEGTARAPMPQSFGPSTPKAGANTEIPPFGGPGKENSRDLCDAGQYLVGVNVRAGLWWDQVQIKCAPIAGVGELGPATEPRRPRGGNGGKEPVFYRCQTGVMVAAYIFTTKQNQVSFVELGCSDNPHVKGNVKIVPTDGRRFAEGHRQNQTCPVGEAATGFNIHYSQYVNALGLICDPYTGQAAPSATDVAFAEQRKDEMQVTGKTTDECQASNMACVSRVTTAHGAANAPAVIARECQPYVAQCMANAAAAQQAANKAFAEQRAEEIKVTGKTAAQCQASNATCEARGHQYGSPSSIAYIATECRPYFAQCMANAPKAEADAAAAKQALEEQIAEEKRITGRTAAQCAQSNQSCEARAFAQYGPINAVGVIAEQCRPFFQQCLSNAAAEAAAGATTNTPQPGPAPTGNVPQTTSICGLPGGPATVVLPNSINAVNVREFPNGPIMKQIPKGSPVNIVGGCGDQIAAGIVAPRPGQNDGQKAVTGWCAISLPLIGCVAEQFLAAGFPAGDLAPAAGIVAPEPSRGNFDADGDRPDGMTARVVKDVNLRTGRGTKDTKVITQLHHGIKVGVIECEKGWCRVRAGNRQGWVSQNYLRFEDNGGFADNDGFDGGEPQFEPQRDVPFDDGPQTTSNCGIPGGIATVSIPNANVNDLNVRDKPNGTILGRIPEGSQVNVFGGCGAQIAAGIVAQRPADGGQQGGVPGWCAISTPELVGCVSEQFLVAGIPTGDLAPAAGIVAPRGTTERSFTGVWNATAQGSSYEMTLDHDGDFVSGSYSSSDGSEGRIDGRVRGNVLRFSWEQVGLGGSGKFTLSEDANSFRGSFTFGDNPDVVEGRWNGKRRQ